eukprot:7384077-Prymnesium_polylepis.2
MWCWIALGTLDSRAMSRAPSSSARAEARAALSEEEPRIRGTVIDRPAELAARSTPPGGWCVSRAAAGLMMPSLTTPSLDAGRAARVGSIAGREECARSLPGNEAAGAPRGESLLCADYTRDRERAPRARGETRGRGRGRCASRL